MFERFSDRARRVLVLAQDEARVLGHRFLGTEHLLLGLIREEEGVAARALESLGISLEAARARVREVIGPRGASSATGAPPFTPRAKKVLELSLREALQLGHQHIDTEHLLLGLVREGEGVAAQVLQSLGADLEGVRQRVLGLLSAEAPHKGLEAGVLRSRAPTPIARFDWPIYPTKVLAGPHDPLTATGTELRIVGLLLFETGIEVKWEVAHPTDPWEHLAPELSLADDLDTTYRAVQGQHTPRRDDTWAGRTFFIPAVPDEATVLRCSWNGQSVEFEL